MADTFLCTFLFLISLILIFKFMLQTKRRRQNLPPSPLSLPVIGHLHLLKPPAHRTFHRLSQKYGPIFSLWFGSQRVVVVSSASAAEECFTKNDIVLCNRPPSLIGKHIGYNYTTVSWSPYGDHWRNLRRLTAVEILSSGRLNMFSDIRRDEVKRTLSKLAQNSLCEFAKVEMRSLLSGMAYNIIMTMVAGKRYYGDGAADAEEAEEFTEIVAEVFSCAGATNRGDYLPVLKWIGFGGYEKKVVRVSKRADAFLQGLIDEHRRRSTSSDGTHSSTMIDHLLSLQKSDPDYYTDQLIKGLTLNLFLAGTETSAITVEWALSNLLNHPHVLQKARAELDSQLCQDHLVNEQDISKLQYLQAIISETLRLNLPSPLLMQHYSSHHCTISGFDVPRGTMVLINAWAIHRDPKLWDDPESFRPERFVNGTNDDEAQYTYKLLPFGLGRRACPGVGLAQRVVGLTLASLIQCFNWERVGEKKMDMTEIVGLALSKGAPLEAMCKARPIINKILS